MCLPGPACVCVCVLSVSPWWQRGCQHLHCPHHSQHTQLSAPHNTHWYTHHTHTFWCDCYLSGFVSISHIFTVTHNNTTVFSYAWPWPFFLKRSQTPSSREVVNQAVTSQRFELSMQFSKQTLFLQHDWSDGPFTPRPDSVKSHKYSVASALRLHQAASALLKNAPQGEKKKKITLRKSGQDSPKNFFCKNLSHTSKPLPLPSTCNLSGREVQTTTRNKQWT